MVCDLYRVFNEDGKLLYVGVSIHTLIRIHNHKKGSLWYGLVRRVDIEKFDTREEALVAEKKAIETESPMYNLLNSVVIKNEITPARKSYASITTQQLLDYLKVDNLRQMGVLLRCNDVNYYKKLGDRMTSRVFFNIQVRMKKCKIPVPKEW